MIRLIHSTAGVALAFFAFLTSTSRAFTPTTPPYGLDSRPSVGSYLDGVFPPQPPTTPSNWSTVVAFPNLTFQNPMGVLPVPGTNKLIVWEREGRAYVFDNVPNVSTKTLVFDVSNQCQGWDDCGMLSMAFHPNFVNNRYLYVYYTWVTPGTVVGSPTTRPPSYFSNRNRLARFTLDANGVAVPGSEFVVFDQNAGASWHHGGGMFFHPDNGFLYMTIGNDRERTMLVDQRIDGGLFGGMIRIDVDKRGGSISHAPPRTPSGIVVQPNSPTYFIPNTNPFVGVASANEEFYALGLRSPHRMTIDPLTKRIFIGDVGESTWEEINIIEPIDPGGFNFQWHVVEGPTGGNNGDLIAPYVGINKRPYMSFPHTSGTSTVPEMKSIIGGYVYRGREFSAELSGKYIFADNFSGNIYYLNEPTSGSPTATFIATLPKSTDPNSGNDYTSISSFGVDANNDLYFARLGNTQGKIFKLQRGAAPSLPLPSKLSETGAFTNLQTLTPSSKLVPFSINLPFWSDNAIKSRWAAIPNGSSIGFAPDGQWTFPTGSVMVKHFDIGVDDNNPAARRRLETRFLVKMNTGGVYGATYKWRPDNSDADLLDNGLTESIPVAITPLGSLTGADIGAPVPAGSTTRVGDEVTIVAGGSDIWNNSDKFHFAYQQRTGDFDISVLVESLTEANLYTKAGLMARENLTPGSRHIYAMAFPSNKARSNNVGGYEFQYRATSDGSSAAIYPAVPQPNNAYPNGTWIRLKRAGSLFIAYWSNNGVTWTEYARLTQTMPNTLYFGLAVTSHTNSATTTAKFMLQNTRLQPWYYPSRLDCVTCHNSQTAGFLGPKTMQMNKDHLYPNGVVDNEIRTWNHIGMFTSGPAEADIPSLGKFANPNDPNETLSKRARSYLDANCSQCHRPGVAQAAWDARFETRLSQQGIINGSVGNTLGITGAKVVVPQDLSKSILYQRVNRVGANQMPPLARNLIDENGVAMLAAWINQPPVSPTVTMTGLTGGSAFLDSDTITLTANAADGDGEVDHVEFYDGNVKIGEDFSPPYSLAWNGKLSSGWHNLRVVAYDNTNRVASSTTVSVNVMPLKLDMTNVVMQPGNPPSMSMTLQANLPAGRDYVIEWSNDLTSWQAIRSGTTDGTPISVDLSSPNAPSSFYRLRLTN